MTELAALSGLRERKKRETRDRLLATAFEMFQADGYEATTLAGIADRAGVSPRTVSNYFPAKCDLLVAYREDVLRAIELTLAERRDLRPIERVRAALLASGRENQRHPNGRLVQNLLARHGSNQALRGIHERFRRQIRATLEGAEVRAGVDLDLAVLALSAGHLAVLESWAAGAPGSLVGRLDHLFDQWRRGVASES